MTATFRDRLLAGEQLMGTFLSTGSELAAEACAIGGLDWGFVDLEHGFIGENGLVGLSRALALHGAAAVARVETTERIRIGQALDAGADAVMLPRIDNVDQARAVLRHLRYPPAGDRGVAGYTRARMFGHDGRDADDVNGAVVGILQIESVSALDQVDALAALPGVDALFVGPSDLSAAMGIPRQLQHPDFLAAVRSVADSCRNSGIACGILSFGTDTVPGYAELGYTLHAVGSDANILARECQAIAAARPGPCRASVGT